MSAQKRNLQVQMVSLKNAAKPYKKELIPILHDHFQKIEMLLKSFAKATIILYQNQTETV